MGSQEVSLREKALDVHWVFTDEIFESYTSYVHEFVKYLRLVKVNRICWYSS